MTRKEIYAEPQAWEQVQMVLDAQLRMNSPLPLGTETEWGIIEMIGVTGGERYYWMIDEDKIVSMIPAFMVEAESCEP